MMQQMTPQDQVHLMALLEEQARMMAQFMPGLISPVVNPAFQQQQQQPQGRPLLERVEQAPKPQGSFSERAAQKGLSVRDGTDGDVKMSEQEEQKDPQTTICAFNLKCTKKDCPFAHQSTAAPEGTPIDVNDNCSFGAACKNRKCTARHPSPALKSAHHAEEICRFFPNCVNPNCTFKHPSMPLCRNGADCSVPGCKFTHLQTPCKYHPCLNPSCPYKHAAGQRGAFPDKVWTAGSTKTHVSERKFVADTDAPEELLKPETTTAASTTSNETQSHEISI